MKYLDGFFIYWKGLLQKSKFVFALFFLLLTILQTVKQTYVFASANHLVISEIQIQGDKSNYDFIELYNPTENSINLGTYRLVKRTSTGATDSNIVAFTQDDEVPSHGYFLWCNTELGTLISCDKTTSSTLANNNSVAIRDGAADTGTIIDAVTFGEVTNTLGEGTALTAPEANQSVERKANSGSTPETMQQGGVDEFLGNGEDTNDNQSDFVTEMTSQPQNKNSQAEPAGVLPSLTPSPTVNPTNTPIPTQEPTVTPTATLTPIPEVTITPTQTPIPTNLPTPTLAPEPTVTPAPGPEEGKVFLTLNFNVGRSSCQVKYKYIRKGWFAFYLPEITCTRNTNSLPWFIS